MDNIESGDNRVRSSTHLEKWNQGARIVFAPFAYRQEPATSTTLTWTCASANGMASRGRRESTITTLYYGSPETQQNQPRKRQCPIDISHLAYGDGDPIERVGRMGQTMAADTRMVRAKRNERNTRRTAL